MAGVPTVSQCPELPQLQSQMSSSSPAHTPFPGTGSGMATVTGDIQAAQRLNISHRIKHSGTWRKKTSCESCTGSVIMYLYDGTLKQFSSLHLLFLKLFTTLIRKNFQKLFGILEDSLLRSGNVWKI